MVLREKAPAQQEFHRRNECRGPQTPLLLLSVLIFASSFLLLLLTSFLHLLLSSLRSFPTHHHGFGVVVDPKRSWTGEGRPPLRRRRRWRPTTNLAFATDVVVIFVLMTMPAEACHGEC
jgi:hypothetical protein